MKKYFSRKLLLFQAFPGFPSLEVKLKILPAETGMREVIL